MTYYEPKDIQRLLGIGRDRLFSWVRAGQLKPAIPSKRPRSKSRYSLRNLAWMTILDELDAWGLLYSPLIGFQHAFPNVSFKFTPDKNDMVLKALEEKKNMFDIIVSDREYFEKAGFVIYSLLKKDPSSSSSFDISVKTLVGPRGYLRTLAGQLFKEPRKPDFPGGHSLHVINILALIHKVESLTGEKME